MNCTTAARAPGLGGIPTEGSPALEAAETLRYELAKATLGAARDEGDLRIRIAGYLTAHGFRFVRDLELPPVFTSGTPGAYVPFLVGVPGVLIFPARQGFSADVLAVLRELMKRPEIHGAVVVANLLRSQRVPVGLHGKPVRLLDLKWGRA